MELFQDLRYVSIFIDSKDLIGIEKWKATPVAKEHIKIGDYLMEAIKTKNLTKWIVESENLKFINPIAMDYWNHTWYEKIKETKLQYMAFVRPIEAVADLAIAEKRIKYSNVLKTSNFSKIESAMKWLQEQDGF